MKITPFKTHIIKPGSDLLAIVDRYLPRIEEQNIVVITSKIVSLSQNRVIKKSHVKDKMRLVQQEADYYIDGPYLARHGVCLTIKNDILIPAAGIDESNGGENYILYPQNIQTVAAELWHHLRKQRSISKLGVLITDSRSSVMRIGITGIAIGWCGFEPLIDYVNQPDLFARSMHTTKVNVLDSLAAAAVYVIGEGKEQTPLALIEDVLRINFENHPPTQKQVESISISQRDDIYSPLLQGVKWKRSAT